MYFWLVSGGAALQLLMILANFSLFPFQCRMKVMKICRSIAILLPTRGKVPHPLFGLKQIMCLFVGTARGIDNETTLFPYPTFSFRFKKPNLI